MSANVYSIESLLLGKMYRSNTIQGEIISVEKHPKNVWYKDCESYLVEIAANSGYGAWRRNFRTVAVRIND